MWLGALHFSRGHRFACANHTELFVELGTDGVLSALAESREERDGVNSVFAAENGECAAIFVVRVCGDTHHCPRVCQVKQRLVDLGLLEPVARFVSLRVWLLRKEKKTQQQ